MPDDKRGFSPFTICGKFVANAGPYYVCYGSDVVLKGNGFAVALVFDVRKRIQQLRATG